MIYHYLKLAFRGLRRYKVQNLFCILGLTIGFSAFILGTYWWYWENHFDNFHPDIDRVYTVTTCGIFKSSDGYDRELHQVPKEDVNYFLQALPEIESYCYLGYTGLTYKKDEITEELSGIDADSAFFNILYSQFIAGGYKNVPFDGSHIVLTEKIAKKFFGTINCTGEIFPLKSGFKKIAGVIKDYPTNTNFRVFEFVKLNSSFKKYNNMNRTKSFYIKFHEKVDVDAARKKIEEHQSVAVMRFIEEQDEVKNYSFRLRRLSEVHIFCSPELKGRFLNIQLLGFAGILALICSLMNALVLFIGLQQRKLQKNKTFRSMGASTYYLFWKSFTDLLVPIIIALLLAIYLIFTVFPYYQNYTQWEGYGSASETIIKIDMSELAVYAAQNFGLVAGMFLLLSSLIIIALVREKGYNRFSFSVLRNLLIVIQVFIGCFFFFIALSLYKQVRFTQTKDNSIVIENITQIDVGSYTKIDFRMLGQELLRSPYIEDVTFTTIQVLDKIGEWYFSGGGGSAFFKDNPDEKVETNIFLIEPNFFDFFGMQLKEGGWMIDENDVIINNSQFQTLRDKNPIGRHIQMHNFEDIKICGVINDYYHAPLQYPVQKLFFHLSTEKTLGEYAYPYQYIYIKTRPENHDKAIEYANSVVEKEKTEYVAPGKRFIELSSVQEEFDRPEKILFRIFGFLSLICILVVAFGIYSLVSLTIEQRKKEIAIRKINGAEIRDILVLFTKNYLVLVIVGNVLSLPVAYFFIVRWLEYYAYRTSLSWWLFAVVFVVTCLIVLFSIFEKVRKAANENPAEVIKQ
jgi:ABC-type antimicrobial peptide transport system permease subunit